MAAGIQVIVQFAGEGKSEGILLFRINLANEKNKQKNSVRSSEKVKDVKGE